MTEILRITTKESVLVTHKIVISTLKNILSSQHTFKDCDSYSGWIEKLNISQNSHVLPVRAV